MPYEASADMCLDAQVAISSVVGGVVAEIGGGNFANGAVTGAYQVLFNHAMHPENHGGGEPPKKKKGVVGTVVDEVSAYIGDLDDGIYTLGISPTISPILGGSFELGVALDFNRGEFAFYATFEAAIGPDLSSGIVFSHHTPTQGRGTITVQTLGGWGENHNVGIGNFGATWGGNSFRSGLNPMNLSSNNPDYKTFSISGGPIGGLPLTYSLRKGVTFVSPTYKFK